MTAAPLQADALVRARQALRQPGSVLILDVDGTLADDVARRHLRPVADPHCLGDVSLHEIERYMAPELVARDYPLDGAQLFLSSLLAVCSHRCTIVVITARWEMLRETTTRWLDLHYLGLRPFSLAMRPPGEHARPSVGVKLELAQRLVGRTGVWLDDDPAMLAAAAQNGFVSLKAPEIYSRLEDSQ